jgi:hypothetical protein
MSYIWIHDCRSDSLHQEYVNENEFVLSCFIVRTCEIH